LPGSFFVSDEFICDALKAKSSPLRKPAKREYASVMTIQNTEQLRSFFHSMMSYFGAGKEPDHSLLELKFRELILTVADDPNNSDVLSYFCSLLNEPQADVLQRVMHDNYCFNLKLGEYAELSNRSLLAFKRDFQKIFKTIPGKWLLEKRLNHAMNLLRNMDKTVSEAAFESGFENPSHFSRAFKERYGIAPAAMKQTQTV
jgi:AraC-like DNA-binding protein